MPSTTSHDYALDCPNESLDGDEELGSAEITYQIQSTSQCSGLHSTHLFRSGQDRVRVSELLVPGDELKVVILWRSGISETIAVSRVSGSTGHSQDDDSSNGLTVLLFEVPTASQGSTTWSVSGGSPGFKLTVKVTRMV